MITPQERDAARMEEIRRLDAEREAKLQARIATNNAAVVQGGVQAEKARREQNTLIERNWRAERQKKSSDARRSQSS